MYTIRGRVGLLGLMASIRIPSEWINCEAFLEHVTQVDMVRPASQVQVVPCADLETRRLCTECEGLLLVLGHLVPLMQRNLKERYGLFHNIDPHPLNSRELCGTLEIQEVIECDFPITARENG